MKHNLLGVFLLFSAFVAIDMTFNRARPVHQKLVDLNCYITKKAIGGSEWIIIDESRPECLEVISD